MAQWEGFAHQCRGAAALNVLGDAVEDGYAPAYREQQDGQQRADSPDAPSSPPAWLACLCPYLFGCRSALHLVQGYGDISCVRLRLCTARRPGFNCDHGEASQQQDDGDGVQRLVEGEGVVDGGCSAQVPGC